MEAMIVVVGLGLGGAVVVVLVVTLILHAVQRERERKTALEHWAASRGWGVVARPHGVEWTDQVPGRHRRGVSLLLSGTVDGWPVTVADYAYTTTTAGGTAGQASTTTHRFVVTAVRLGTPYPRIAVQPRGALSRFGRSLFGDGAAATGNEEFDRQFRVHTGDPAYARTIVGPTLVAEHLAGRVPAWSLSGHHLLTWEPGRLTEPDRIESRARQLTRVIGLLGR